MPPDGNKIIPEVSVPNDVPALVYPTLAAVLAEVPTWADLPNRQRACMISALKLLERLSGLPPFLVVLDPAVIGPLLEGTSAAACGMKPSSLTTYKVQIRHAMRRFKLIDLPSRSRAPLSQEWLVLRASLPDHHINSRLQDFMSVCDAHHILPGQVDEKAVLLYAQTLRTRRLTRFPAQTRAKLVQAWNTAVGTVAGWPQRRLVNPVTRKAKTIPPTQWSLPFKEDVKRFEREASQPQQGERFTRENAGPVLRQETIKSRVTGIRMAVTAYVALGNPLQDLVALDQLLVPQTMVQIMNHVCDGYGGALTGSVRQLGTTLRCVARYRHPEESDVVKTARVLAKQATPPKQKGLSRRTEDRLMQFIDAPLRRAALLSLPKRLLEDASDLKAAGKGRQAAWMAADAIAIAIELHCPLRLRALTNLRMGEELTRVGGDGARWTQFVIEGDINKTEVPLRWPVAPALSAMIDTYIAEYRPLGSHPETAWLFPARDAALVPRHQNGFSRAISEAIYRYVGAEVNVHLFRAFAGMLILEANPDALDDLRQLLGHSTLDTALRYYAFRQRLKAADRIDTLITHKIAEAAPAGRDALEKWQPRRKSSGPKP